MTIELWALFGCTIILLVSITIQALHLDKFAGYAYTLGNRDSGDLELSPLARRLKANVGNQVEGLAMFLPLVVIIQFSDVNSILTEAGSVAYFCSRFIYLLCYTVGIKVIRSIVWLLGIAALLAIISGVLIGA